VSDLKNRHRKRSQSVRGALSRFANGDLRTRPCDMARASIGYRSLISRCSASAVFFAAAPTKRLLSACSVIELERSVNLSKTDLGSSAMLSEAVHSLVDTLKEYSCSMASAVRPGRLTADILSVTGANFTFGASSSRS
jgi:hypothetical protein